MGHAEVVAHLVRHHGGAERDGPATDFSATSTPTGGGCQMKQANIFTENLPRCIKISHMFTVFRKYLIIFYQLYKISRISYFKSGQNLAKTKRDGGKNCEIIFKNQQDFQQLFTNNLSADIFPFSVQAYHRQLTFRLRGKKTQKKKLKELNFSFAIESRADI